MHEFSLSIRRMCGAVVAAVVLSFWTGGGLASADDGGGFVLCLLGDECRLTTLERCIGKGGVPSPTWEDCLPKVSDFADSMLRSSNGGPPTEEGTKSAECSFPIEITIRGRNRLVYVTHAYERTFGRGQTVRIDFGIHGFVISDSLVHAPHPGPRVARADLELLGDYFGMTSGPARNPTGRDAVGSVGDSGLVLDSSGEFYQLSSSTPQAFPTREEACIWARMAKLLEHSTTPLELRLDRGETSLLMSPMDEGSASR